MKKQSRKVNMIRVPNVRIGKDVCAVRFKAIPGREVVKCMTKGQEPLFISHVNNRFVVTRRGQDDNINAQHPSLAFAKAVKEFWTLW